MTITQAMKLSNIDKKSYIHISYIKLSTKFVTNIMYMWWKYMTYFHIYIVSISNHLQWAQRWTQGVHGWNFVEPLCRTGPGEFTFLHSPFILHLFFNHRLHLLELVPHSVLTFRLMASTGPSLLTGQASSNLSIYKERLPSFRAWKLTL